MIFAKDGHQLVTIHEKSGSDEVVLLCHGITSEKNEAGVFSSFAARLGESGFDSLRFDFRAHGDSSMSGEQASVSGMVLDLHAALSYCAESYKLVHVVAASFGASILLMLAKNGGLSHYEIGRASLWNPVTDYASTFFRATVPWGPSFFPQGTLGASIDAAPISFGENSLSIGPQFIVDLFAMEPQYTRWDPATPLLVLHGEADTVVNVQDTVRFVEQSAQSAILHVYPGVDHGLDEVMDDVQERTLDFLRRR